ncbi:hypothetical protein ACIG0D_01190 [Streptomyces sp. NPDC052773]|uniref:hypothetical protein n=1 Tax=Streptomyces sp. NPDC052773 TaxID=3365693 RepID=UPI0037D35595
MNAGIWARPAAGREPAGAALLSWLADPAAPRLCLVTGSAGCGKSQLLAWLVAHGTRPGTAPERRVHGFAPLSGQGVLVTVWTLAEQLGVTARAPGELRAALAADQRRTVIVLPDLHAATDPLSLIDLVSGLVGLEHIRLVVEARTGDDAVPALKALAPAVLDLDEPHWTDPARAEAWRATHPTPLGPPPAETAEEPLNLDDPDVICTADPSRVTTAYETNLDEQGGLRAAWLRAGQSLLHDHEPADRALVLLAGLGDGADPRVRPALEQLASGAPWRLLWSRVRGDVTPPWPGPVLALASDSPGPLEGRLLVADHQGTLRLVSLSDAAPAGRLPEPVRDVADLCALPDGTVAVVDSEGRLHTRRLPTAPRPSGLAALLDDGPSASERAAGALVTAAADERATAIAASELAVALADVTGQVHVVLLGNPKGEALSERLHEGSVRALAVVDVAVDRADGAAGRTPLVYSGGADGRVRAWGPGHVPMGVPVAERPRPVNALAATMTKAGLTLAVAWGDGLIEYHRLDAQERLTFRPGPPVNSLSVTGEGDLLIGTDESLICLRLA